MDPKVSAAAWMKTRPTGSFVALDFFLSTCCLVVTGPASCPQLSPFDPAALPSTLWPHTPKPSSQLIPGASHQIRPFRAGSRNPLPTAWDTGI